MKPLGSPVGFPIYGCWLLMQYLSCLFFLHRQASHVFRNSDDLLQAVGGLEHISSKLRTSVSGA